MCHIFGKHWVQGCLQTIFLGVWHANTITQIHIYSVNASTAIGEMALNTIKSYIFEKPPMQRYKRYFELSNIQIQNTNIQIYSVYINTIQMLAWHIDDIQYMQYMQYIQYTKYETCKLYIIYKKTKRQPTNYIYPPNGWHDIYNTKISRQYQNYPDSIETHRTVQNHPDSSKLSGQFWKHPDSLDSIKIVQTVMKLFTQYQNFQTILKLFKTVLRQFCTVLKPSWHYQNPNSIETLRTVSKLSWQCWNNPEAIII